MHMNTKTPVVELEDIRLEPFDIGKHLTDRYVSWLNDPTVVRYSEQRHRRHTLDSCGAFARSFSESPNYFWAIIANTTASIHIGNLVAYIDPHNRLAELSILIGEAVGRGRGLGTKAWIAALNYTLQVAEMRKVFAGTMAENTPMLRVFSRSGMRIECKQTRHFLFEGREVDLIIASSFSPITLSKRD